MAKLKDPVQMSTEAQVQEITRLRERLVALGDNLEGEVSVTITPAEKQLVKELEDKVLDMISEYDLQKACAEENLKKVASLEGEVDRLRESLAEMGRERESLTARLAEAEERVKAALALPKS